MSTGRDRLSGDALGRPVNPAGGGFQLRFLNVFVKVHEALEDAAGWAVATKVGLRAGLR